LNVWRETGPLPLTLAQPMHLARGAPASPDTRSVCAAKDVRRDNGRNGEHDREADPYPARE